jgi:hypothetical protein
MNINHISQLALEEDELRELRRVITRDFYRLEDIHHEALRDAYIPSDSFLRKKNILKNIGIKIDKKIEELTSLLEN